MSDEQNTDFDLSSAIEKIQEMMSNDEGQSQLNRIISAFTAGTEEKSESAKGGGGFPDFDGIDQIDMMIKLGNILSAMKSESGGKSEALLYAIKPYLGNVQTGKDGQRSEDYGHGKGYECFKGQRNRFGVVGAFTQKLSK